VGLLADIYSYGDGLKRKVNGLLADPSGTLEQMVGRLKDDQNAMLNLQANAYPMAGDKTVLNSPEQIARFRSQLADKGAEMALAGMTAVKFVYPQAKALETAQRNAAKPISDGGLGLPANNSPLDRAKAMGFGEDLFHGRKGDYSAFDKNLSGLSTQTKGVSRSAVDLTTDPSVASDYAQWARIPETSQLIKIKKKMARLNTLIPEQSARWTELYHQADRLQNTPGIAGFSMNSELSKHGANVMPIMSRGRLLEDSSGKWNQTVRREALKDASERGLDGVAFRGVPDVLPHFKDPSSYRHDTTAVLNPEVLRSRFAAFDPARRNEADILGRADPELLKWMAGAGLLGTAGYSALQDR
jgi:hypothetical protein